MSKKLLITCLVLTNIFYASLSSKEIKEDNNLKEKVSFNIWWEDKYNNSVITFRTYPEDIKTIQVGNGKSINKNQVLEIYKDFNFKVRMC